MSDLVERYRRQIEVALKYANDEKPAHDRILPSVFELQVGHLRDIGNELAAELSRLSALVAEWQKAGAEAEAQMMALYISVSPHATYERDGKIGNRFADEDHAIAGLRRLSQLKDTTNADK